MTYLGLTLAAIMAILVSHQQSVAALVWYSLAGICVAGGLAARQSYLGRSVVMIIGISLMLAGRTAQIEPVDQAEMATLDGQMVIVVGVAQRPKNSDKSVTVIINKASIAANNQASIQGPAVMGVLPLYAPVDYGDQVKLVGKLQAAVSEETGFGTYLLNHHIVGSVVYPQVTVLSHHQGNRLLELSWRAEQLVEQRLLKLLPQDEAGLLLGIVLGVPAALSQSIEDALKLTGTTHIVVASGYNISILIALCTKLKYKVGNSGSILLAMVIIICYCLMSGASASIIRAGLMAGVTFAAVSFGRQKQAVRFLMLVGLVMLFINPLWLLDTGFQLSFAATMGILLFQKAIQQPLDSWPSWLSEPLSTTLAAQVLVVPVLACTFGSVSLISLVANVVVLWTIPAIMLVGFAVVLTSLMWLPLGQALALMIHPLLWYVTQIIELLSRIPFASISLELNWWWAIPYYLVILAIVRWRQIGVDSAIELKVAYAT